MDDYGLFRVSFGGVEQGVRLRALGIWVVGQAVFQEVD